VAQSMYPRSLCSLFGIILDVVGTIVD